MKGGAVLEGNICRLYANLEFWVLTVFAAPLFNFLERFQPAAGGTQSNGAFGDIRKLVSEIFVKQMYVKREKTVLETAAHEERFQYTWNIRAHHEFPKQNMLDNVAKVYWSTPLGSISIYCTVSVFAQVMNRPASQFKKQFLEIHGDEAAEAAEAAEGGGNNDQSMDTS